MAGTGDPSEDVAEVTLVNASEVASTWAGIGTALDGIGHQIAALKATGVSFPEKVTSAMFGIGQGCTSVGAQWTTASGDVQTQHDQVDTPKSADYKRTTAEVKQAKEATAQGLMIAAMGGSPSYAESAAANLATKRAARQQVLDTAVSDTATRIQPLPGHAKLAGDAVTTARGSLVTQSGGQAMPADVAQIVPPKVSPSGNPSGGPNKPASNTPTGNKPSGEKPTDEKKGGDEKGSGTDPSGGGKPQGQQGQQQPNAQQGGQPQQQGGAQPAGGTPAGGQPASQQRSPGVLPVSTPTPARGADPSKSGPSVRPTTPPAPPSTPGQRAGVDGRTSPLGSGTTATGAGSGAPTANKSGGVGSGSGAGSGSSSSGAGARPMSGGMMGGGHGAGGGQGGTARPKAEVKADPANKVLRGEDVAEQALGGVVTDGDTGAPVPPPRPTKP